MKGAIDGLLGYQPTLEPRIAGATAEFQKRASAGTWTFCGAPPLPRSCPRSRQRLDHLVRPGAPIIVSTPAYMPFLPMIPGSSTTPVIEVPSLRGTRAGGHGWAPDLERIRAGLAPRGWPRHPV